MTEGLEELIDHSSVVKLDTVPTTSAHTKLVKKIFNNVLTTHSEYQTMLMCLACYPTQVWAKQIREKLNINTMYIREIIEEDAGQYITIQQQTIELLFNNLKTTDQIIDKLKELYASIIDKNEKDVIGAIHFNKNDVSFYNVNKYYEDALIHFCEKNNNEFNKLITKIKVEDDLEFDSEYALHNTELLMFNKARWQETNNDYMLTKIDELIRSLKTYSDDKDIYNVIYLFSIGESETSISKRMNKSRTYIRQKREEGIFALSCLLWGYSMKNILENITKE